MFKFGKVEVGRWCGSPFRRAQGPDRRGAGPNGEEPAPLSRAADMAVLFAPGIPDLHRPAQQEEIVLWRACAAPRPAGALIRRKGRRQMVLRLATEGVLDIVA